MATVFKRILEKKIESEMTWEEIAKAAHIKLSSWMTGVPYASPKDDELHKLAPVLKTTYEWLKYGKEGE